MKPNKEQTKEKDQRQNRQNDKSWQKEHPSQSSKTPQKIAREDKSEQKHQGNGSSKKSGQGMKNDSTNHSDVMEDENERPEVPGKGKREDPNKVKREEPTMETDEDMEEDKR